MTKQTVFQEVTESQAAVPLRNDASKLNKRITVYGETLFSNKLLIPEQTLGQN